MTEAWTIRETDIKQIALATSARRKSVAQ